ncbi:hypothetical protein AB37_5069 [Escherichia coli 8-415-05_S1_C2]|nr:hypothetical protein AB37_5069 [Escherichia coli 8-415-05_S1_C2]
MSYLAGTGGNSRLTDNKLLSTTCLPARNHLVTCWGVTLRAVAKSR